MTTNFQKIPNVNSFSDHTEFTALFQQLAKQFREATDDLKIKSNVLKYWSDDLLLKWINDPTMPLYIRKSSATYLKGKEIKHKSGRILIPVDNGPAHWALSMAFNENMPTLESVRAEWINQDRINIGMIISKDHASKVKYKCADHIVDNPNEKGWKVAHIEAIGINSRTPLESVDLKILTDHFFKFLNPANMFLIPKKYSGLAEIEEFLKSLQAISQ